MGKKNKQNWQRNIKIDPTDNAFLNTKHWFVPEDFEHDLSDDEIEVVLDYLNRLRIEYISLRWNGMPLKSYKPDVFQKIQERKDIRLANKSRKAENMLKFAKIKLKDDFDPLDENSKPRRKE